MENGKDWRTSNASLPAETMKTTTQHPETVTANQDSVKTLKTTSASGLVVLTRSGTEDASARTTMSELETPAFHAQPMEELSMERSYAIEIIIGTLENTHVTMSLSAETMNHPSTMKRLVFGDVDAIKIVIVTQVLKFASMLPHAPLIRP